MIAQDEEASLLYARDVLKERFPPGEESLKKTAKRSYRYALTVLKGAFPEEEAVIAGSSKYANLYAFFLKNRFLREKKRFRKAWRILIGMH